MTWLGGAFLRRGQGPDDLRETGLHCVVASHPPGGERSVWAKWVDLVVFAVCSHTVCSTVEGIHRRMPSEETG